RSPRARQHRHAARGHPRARRVGRAGHAAVPRQDPPPQRRAADRGTSERLVPRRAVRDLAGARGRSRAGSLADRRGAAGPPRAAARAHRPRGQELRRLRARSGVLWRPGRGLGGGGQRELRRAGSDGGRHGARGVCRPMSGTSRLFGALAAVAALLTACPGRPRANDRPTSAAEALGSLDGLEPALRRAFEPADDFAPIPTPGPGDWLHEHPDEGQGFDQYVASEPNMPVPWRSKIYIQPIGEISSGPSLAELEDYAERYFGGMDVVVLPSISAEATGARTREHHGHTQLLAPDVTGYLKARLPRDGYC